MYSIDTAEAMPCFEFAIDGDKYAVTLLDAMPVDAMRGMGRELRGIADATERTARYVEMVRELFDTDAPGAVERLNARQWRGLLQAYLEACEVSMGES